MSLRLEIQSGVRAGDHHEYPDGEKILIGRDDSSELIFPPQDEVHVSARHARIAFENGGWYIEDCRSTNGTFVNGAPVATKTRLKSGDEIGLGRMGPRIKVQVAVPKTVLEPLKTVAERAVGMDTDMPAAPAAISFKKPDAWADPVAASKAKAEQRPVGSKTVLQMIDSAMEQARQARPGGFRGTTVFMQEIVRQAVRESSKKLRLTIAVFAVVVVVLIGAIVFQGVQMRQQQALLRESLITQYEKSLDGVRAQLGERREEIEAKRVVYEATVAELRGTVDEALRQQGGYTEEVDRLSRELAESRESARQTARDLGALEAQYEAVRRQIEFGGGDGRAELARTQRAIGDTRDRFTKEKATGDSLQAELTSQIQKAAGTGDKSGQFTYLAEEIGSAENAIAQYDHDLSELDTKITQSDRGKKGNLDRFNDQMLSGPEVAVPTAIGTIEDSARPSTAFPLSSLSIPASLEHRFSKPVAKTNLKKRVAVGRFECLVSNIPWEVSREDVERQIRAQLTTILGETGRFTIVERADLDQILNEQELAQTGVMTTETGPQAGQLLGAQAVVLGKITQLDNQVEKKTSSFNVGGFLSVLGSVGGGFGAMGDVGKVLSTAQTVTESVGGLDVRTQTVTSTFTIHIDVKVVDTNSGEVLLSSAAHGHAKSVRKNTGVGTGYFSAGGNVFRGSDDIADGTRMALFDAAINIVTGLERTPWKGQVMDVGEAEVILNAGADFNIEQGDTFEVRSRGRALTDPETGQPKGFIETPAAVVRVSRVDSDKAFAEVLEHRLPMRPGDFLSLLGTTRSLDPGESSDVDGGHSATKIRYAELGSGNPLSYAGPGTTFGEIPLKKLEPGSPLRLQFAFREWAKVLMPNGSPVWMSTNGLSLKEEVPTKVTSVRVGSRKAEVHMTPSSKDRRVDNLKPGSTATVQQKLGRWYEVYTPNGKKGWVKEGDVMPLDQQQAEIPHDGGPAGRVYLAAVMEVGGLR